MSLVGEEQDSTWKHTADLVISLILDTGTWSTNRRKLKKQLLQVPSKTTVEKKKEQKQEIGDDLRVFFLNPSSRLRENLSKW